MDLPLKGRAAELVTFSPFGLWLIFPDPAAPETSPGSDYVLRIDGPFRVVSPTAVIEVDPNGGPSSAYFGLLQRVVEKAIATEDGSLAISFADGDRLEIPSDVHEPWQLTGKGQSLVSAAGGGLALWNEGGDLAVPLSEFHAR
jgi:Family of unknown function (DUF6188)